MVDELHRIDDLLRMTPDLVAAARLVAEAQGGDEAPGRSQPDDLADLVHTVLGVSLDAEAGGDAPAPDLADLPHAATTVLETARWRLLRVARALALGVRVE